VSGQQLYLLADPAWSQHSPQSCTCAAHSSAALCAWCRACRHAAAVQPCTRARTGCQCRATGSCSAQTRHDLARKCSAPAGVVRQLAAVFGPAHMRPLSAHLACLHMPAQCCCLQAAGERHKGPARRLGKLLCLPRNQPAPISCFCLFVWQKHTCMCVDAVRALDPCVQHVKHMLSVLHSPLGASLEGARSCSALCPHSLANPANQIVALHTCLLLSCRQLTVVLLAWTQHMPCKHNSTCVRN
jgi:hypothetical protein